MHSKNSCIEAGHLPSRPITYRTRYYVCLGLTPSFPRYRNHINMLFISQYVLLVDHEQQDATEKAMHEIRALAELPKYT